MEHAASCASSSRRNGTDRKANIYWLKMVTFISSCCCACSFLYAACMRDILLRIMGNTIYALHTLSLYQRQSAICLLGLSHQRGSHIAFLMTSSVKYFSSNESLTARSGSSSRAVRSFFWRVIFRYSICTEVGFSIDRRIVGRWRAIRKLPRGDVPFPLCILYCEDDIGNGILRECEGSTYPLLMLVIR